MNYQELLDRADYNADTKFKAPVKAPNKKFTKSGVQSDGVRRFLEKRKAEERAKAAEEQKKKEQLLAIRALNTKNNKKAKIMASRTKDNDFSRIRLTEDEIESKKKIENEIQRKHLLDKKERMKARIDLEEKEKMLPHKRKRKSKLNEVDEAILREEQIKEDAKNSSDRDSNRKPQRPPPPPASYMELLKLAETKMHEPIVIPKKKKEAERLLTKKERKLYEEEKERQRRKQERLEQGGSLSSYKTAPPPVKHSVDKKGEKMNEKSSASAQIIKNGTDVDQAPKFKIPKQNIQPDRKGSLSSVDRAKLTTINSTKTSLVHQPHTNHNREQIDKNSIPSEKRQLKAIPKEQSRLSQQPMPAKSAKKKSAKIAPVVSAPQPAPVPQLDTAALAAAIAKQVKEDLEKEMEAKYAAKFASMMEKSNEAAALKSKSSVKLKPTSSDSKVHPPVNGTAKPRPLSVASKQDSSRHVDSKPSVKVQKNSGPPKKSFHINPYLDPPRRLLEPVRPQKKAPPKRRIESDDEDEDMSDFIDDGPSQNDEDYSKYIKEIFGYDRNRYLDDDDDDIRESSFAEQMKEETRSAKLGYLEDLEEERKLREEEKRWKQKHKK